MNQLFYYAIWLSFMACGFLGWYFSHKAKHEERKMLIQNGLSSDEAAKADKGPRLLWLKIGVVIIGLSVGLGIIGILANLGLLGGSMATIPAILGICGGVSLVITQVIDKRSK